MTVNFRQVLRFSASLALFAATAVFAAPQVALQTSEGRIVLELDAKKAPKSTENFLQYARDGHYNGTVFHRVIRNFMIQGGGFDTKLEQKPTRAPIVNEAANGLRNERGTIAMARTGNPHSATSQFFINHRNNPNLDYPSFDGWGYAAFGKVTEGMDVVDRIAGVATGTIKGMENVPFKNVVIESVTILSEK